jgi:hypothetical protein
VTVGTAQAKSITVVNATTITATSPPGTGTVHVTVSTVGGTSAKTVADDYTYLASPTVTKITPAVGPLGGGTVVAVTGTSFTSSSTVSFGGVRATNVRVSGATYLLATSPSGSGSVDVTVTTPGGTSATSSADRFTYLPAPSVSGVSPAVAKAYTFVTITGSGFSAPATVYFGITKASGVTVVNATTITAKVPWGSGMVDVTVTTSGGTSATSPSDRFTY